MLTPKEMAELAVRALDAKKGRDIRLLETKEVTVLADYFLICTANSSTHIKTLSDEVSKVLEEQGERTLRTEGYRNGGWVLVDFGCLVVHLFTEEVRKFYNLERLWADAPVVDVSGLLTE